MPKCGLTWFALAGVALATMGCGGRGLEHRAWAPKDFVNVKPFSCKRLAGATHCDAVISPSGGGALSMVSVVYFDQPDQVQALRQTFQGASSAAAMARGEKEAHLDHTTDYEQNGKKETSSSTCYAASAATRCVLTINPKTAVVLQVGREADGGELLLDGISISALVLEGEVVEDLYRMGAFKNRP